MLISAEKVGIDMDDFYIACLDNESYEKFSYLKIFFPIIDWVFFVT